MRVADFFSKPAFGIIRERSAGKLDVAAHMDAQSVSTSFAGNVAVSELRSVSENFFPMLRIGTFAGRLLDHAGSTPEVLVTYRFWERNLGRSEKAIGQTLRINNFPYVIAGILPRDFFGLTPGDRVELYTTISQSPVLLAPDSWYRSHAENPMAWWLQLMARRSDGVSLESAHAVMNTTFAASWPVQPKTPEQTPRIRLVDAAQALADCGES